MINASDALSLLSSSYDSKSSLSTSQHSPYSSLNLWEYDPAFGIVHHCGCRICRRYMMHISDAEDTDTSHAIQERDAELRGRYLEGFRRGRATQQQHDTEVLKSCRSQRNEARALNSVYELRIDEARREIVQLKDELLALRIAYDDLRPRTPSDDLDWLANEGLEVLTDTTPPLDDSDSPDPVDDTDDPASDSEFEENHSPAESFEEISDDSSVEDTDEEADGLEGPNSNAIEPLDHLSSEPLTTTKQILLCSALSFSVAQGVDLDLDLDDERGQSNAPHLTSSYSPPSIPSPRPETNTLEKVRRQMCRAHRPGHPNTLARVRSMVSDAHKTPAYLRTEAQKVLLAEWRRPTPTPVDILPQDVYVDASGSGIGFFYRGQWQAWKLKAGWKEAKYRDIQWAEAVAVELGIRLLIRAGYTERKIVLRSDNLQVVQAVSNSSIHQSQVGPIVKHINSLCHMYDIDLVVTWIPGADNPADAPSRLSVRDEGQRFPFEIKIPAHLGEFVLPYRR